jgi:hypothetical protein
MSRFNIETKTNVSETSSVSIIRISDTDVGFWIKIDAAVFPRGLYNIHAFKVLNLTQYNFCSTFTVIGESGRMAVT